MGWETNDSGKATDKGRELQLFTSIYIYCHTDTFVACCQSFSTTECGPNTPLFRDMWVKARPFCVLQIRSGSFQVLFCCGKRFKASKSNLQGATFRSPSAEVSGPRHLRRLTSRRHTAGSGVGRPKVPSHIVAQQGGSDPRPLRVSPELGQRARSVPAAPEVRLVLLDLVSIFALARTC